MTNLNDMDPQICVIASAVDIELTAPELTTLSLRRHRCVQISLEPRLPT